MSDLQDLRKINFKSLGWKDKISVFLRSYHLVFIDSAAVLVDFILLVVGGVLVTESGGTPDHMASIQNSYQVVRGLETLVITVFFIELCLQLTIGFGWKNLKDPWFLFDSSIVLTLSVLELATRCGWKDSSSRVWAFLVLFRLARMLKVMIGHATESIKTKRAKRNELDNNSKNLQSQLEAENNMNKDLKEEINELMDKCHKLDESLMISRNLAEENSLTRTDFNGSGHYSFSKF